MGFLGKIIWIIGVSDGIGVVLVWGFVCEGVCLILLVCNGVVL